MEANGEMGPTHLMVPLLNPPALLSYKCLKNISLYIFCVRMLRVEGWHIGWVVTEVEVGVM